MDALRLLIWKNDEESDYSLFYSQLNKLNFLTRECEGDQLLSELARQQGDIILILAPAFPNESFLSYVRELKDIDDRIPIILYSPKADIKTAVSFMKEELFSFVEGGDGFQDLIQNLLAAEKRHRLTQKIFQNEERNLSLKDYGGIIGQSKSMQDLFNMIHKVSKSKATVLLLGESGTGKELVAKAIHNMSPRSKKKMIDMNCGAIPKDLLENELFGHERGAFTGADRRYIGNFERANGGTLFLDEICEMDLDLQVKILRVLQERHFYRVGGTEKVEVDVRIVAATNRDIQKEVELGRFREDLYYRINVVSLNIPSLRERKDDIPLLARHFLQKFSSQSEKLFLDFQEEALSALMQYDWPGNVRELENTIEHIVALANDSQVKVKHLPKTIKQRTAKGRAPQFPFTLDAYHQIIPLEELEKNVITQALRQFEGNVALVAKSLQIGQATLYRKIRKFGIER